MEFKILVIRALILLIGDGVGKTRHKLIIDMESWLKAIR